MEEITKIAVDEYQKNADGSWTCVKNSDITTKTGQVVRIAPGTTFKKGGTFLGLDIVGVLEQISAK